MITPRPSFRVAIACGGTGGHLFPGLAVGQELVARGCDVSLLVSPKDVDQQAVQCLADEFEIVTLPAIGLAGGNLPAFAAASVRSFLAARRAFHNAPPHAVLAMGGFTSAPPVLAGNRAGAVTFLHESNTLPGRANRWLAHVVDECFVGFPEAADRLWNPRVTVSGTPVRPQFAAMDPAGARSALGLDPDKPVLLVMGGSQGAEGVNRLVTAALPGLAAAVPELQFFHLTGSAGLDAVKAAYAPLGRRARVRPFFSEMELLLGAATLAISRSGASSLAELAAMGVPSLLVPYPAAVDDHQSHNAAAFTSTGAAETLVQGRTTPEQLTGAVRALLADTGRRQAMAAAATRLHAPDAASLIAGRILALTSQFHSPVPSRPMPLKPRMRSPKEAVA